jgi:AcrR family transcriptional regulator
MVRPRQFSDADILSAAREVFLESGPSVSTTVIAERIGLSQAALFKRFGTKDDLMVQALTSAGPFPLAGRGGPDARPIATQLQEMADELAAFLARVVPCSAILRAAQIAPEQAFARFDVPPPIVVHRRFVAWLTAAREQGRVRDGVDLEHVALAFMGAMHIRTFLEHIARGRVEQFPLPAGEDYRATLVRMTWALLEPDA